MLKKIGRILLGILLISLMVFLCVFIVIQNQQKAAISGGTITFVVNNIDGEVVEKKRIEYKKDDTLFEVIDNHYKLEYNLTTYGHFLVGISNDSFKIETDGHSSWIWLEVGYLKEDKDYTENINLEDYDIKNASTGIDNIELKDNMIFVMNQRDNLHSVSILNDTISFEKNENHFIFQLIVYITFGLSFVGLLIYLFISHKKDNKLTIKELSILAFMTVILFLQEELLSFIPNFQFTFLLIAVYIKVVGFRKTSVIVLAHILLDNLFMGSVIPYVMIPMIIGYFIYMALIYFFRNKNIYLLMLFGVLGSLIYCYMFLFANIIFLDVEPYAYWILDLPFEGILALTTAITLFYLYEPLSNKLSKLLKKNDNDSITADDKY